MGCGVDRRFPRRSRRHRWRHQLATGRRSAASGLGFSALSGGLWREYAVFGTQAVARDENTQALLEGTVMTATATRATHQPTAGRRPSAPPAAHPAAR